MQSHKPVNSSCHVLTSFFLSTIMVFNWLRLKLVAKYFVKWNDDEFTGSCCKIFVHSHFLLLWKKNLHTYRRTLMWRKYGAETFSAPRHFPSCDTFWPKTFFSTKTFSFKKFYLICESFGILYFSALFKIKYHIVVSTKTCYYSENQIFCF